MAEAYITRQQAAAQLSVSLRTLDGLISRGALPAYRVGPKLVRLKASDVDAYMSGRLVAPSTGSRRGTTPEAPRRCGYVPGMKVV